MNRVDKSSSIRTRRGEFCQSSSQNSIVGTAVIACLCVFGGRLSHDDSNSKVAVTTPVVSPLRDKVAFVLYHETGTTAESQVAVVNVSDGKIFHTNAVTLPGHTMTWSLDQSRIVFISGDVVPTRAERLWALDSIDLSSGKVSQIAQPRVKSPKFSPDGKHLGYVQDEELVVEQIKTGQRQQIQSNVSEYYWCWGTDDSTVFYIRNDFNVCQYDLKSQSERVLFAAPPGDDLPLPEDLVGSPDGSQVGYHFDGWFHTIELESGENVRRFKCDHYFLDFDWNSTGICYVDTVNGERRKQARVMVFDTVTGTSSAVVTGPFSYGNWLGKSKILVRKGNNELWVYDVDDGKGVKVFGATKE